MKGGVQTMTEPPSIKTTISVKTSSEHKNPIGSKYLDDKTSQGIKNTGNTPNNTASGTGTGSGGAVGGGTMGATAGYGAVGGTLCGTSGGPGGPSNPPYDPNGGNPPGGGGGGDGQPPNPPGGPNGGNDLLEARKCERKLALIQKKLRALIHKVNIFYADVQDSPHPTSNSTKQLEI